MDDKTTVNQVSKNEKSHQENEMEGMPARRKALKKIVMGGTIALGASSLPPQWAKPIVDKVVIPAHAQTSPEPSYTLSCHIEEATCSESPVINRGYPVTVTVTGTVQATGSGVVAGLGITYDNKLFEYQGNELDQDTDGLATDAAGAFTITSTLYMPPTHCDAELTAKSWVTLTLTGETCYSYLLEPFTCSCPPRLPV